VGRDRSCFDRDSQVPFPLGRRLSEPHTVRWSGVILASLFDVVTTIVGFGHGLSEGNAVARAFIQTYGTPGIGLLKFSALLFVAANAMALAGVTTPSLSYPRHSGDRTF